MGRVIDMDKLEVARARAEAQARADLALLEAGFDAATADEQTRARFLSQRGIAQRAIDVARHATDYMAEVRRHPRRYAALMREVSP